jgi:GNAT superfamily N-acetyltransferase
MEKVTMTTDAEKRAAPPDSCGGLRLERLTGAALAEHLPALAELRIEVFRSYPYLYDGDPAYERRYLQTYLDTADSALIAAFDGECIVGAATALPLMQETDNVIAPFRGQGYSPEALFYFGESVLLSEYRGRGVGVAFFEHREAHARSFGRFTHACFCGVQRADDDPRRPSDHVPLDDFWRHRGYQPLPNVVAQFAWKEIGDDRETNKSMGFWIKPL